ncbi:MAG TPA: hypothetical protein VF756_05400 [Thermoanaerobaculia bacterium]
MAQIWVAFGQGTGATRVSQEAAMALHARYFGHIQAVNAPSRWQGEGAAVLERIRAIGRLAVHNATLRADTVVSADDVLSAAVMVEAKSDTEMCPPRTV